MADERYRIPHLSQQPPAVDFIDNRLTEYHPMFAGHHSHYDPTAQRFVPNGLPGIVVQSSDNGPDQDLKSSDIRLQNPRANVRPMYSDTKAMIFWNSMFPTAMEKFKSRSDPPKKRSNSSFDIRDKNNWESVYSILEAAKDSYCESSGKRGWIRKNCRWLADHISPIAQTARLASNVVPDNPYATPVLGAVVIILDAIEFAADVRHQALGSFDGLEARFADIQLFVGMFPEDKNVKNASIELTVSVLNAVERGITFFIKNQFSKVGSSVFKGGAYGQELLESIQQIDSHSVSLHTQASKSHMYQVQFHSQQMLNRQDIAIDGINNMTELMNEHDRKMIWMMERICNRIEARHTHEARAARPYMSQEALHLMLDTQDIDLQDAADIMGMKSRFPSKERARVEHVVQTEQFRQWLVSPFSTKLLVHWEPRPARLLGDISPLSVMCGMMARALLSQPRFLPIIFFGGKHVARAQEDPFSRPHAMVRSLIDQLLRHHQFDMQRLPVVDPGSSGSLIPLLNSLVSQLPRTRTLCCIIDGAALLEREEHWTEASPVLAKLVELAGRPGRGAPVKLLLASTPSTTIVRGVFEEGLVMNIGSFREVRSTPSEARMERELGVGVSEAEGNSVW